MVGVFRPVYRQIIFQRKVLSPPRVLGVAGAPTENIGLASETDLAQPLTGSFTVPIGLVSETDLAQPITGTVTVPIGLASETDLAQPLTGSFTVPIGLVSEADLAQPMTVSLPSGVLVITRQQRIHFKHFLGR